MLAASRNPVRIALAAVLVVIVILLAVLYFSGAGARLLSQIGAGGVPVPVTGGAAVLSEQAQAQRAADAYSARMNGLAGLMPARAQNAYSARLNGLAGLMPARAQKAYSDRLNAQAQFYLDMK